MALSKQINKFRLVSNSTNYDINLQNMDFRWEQEFFFEPRVAINGDIDSSGAIGGRRLIIDITYDSNIEPLTWDNMTDSIMGDFIYNDVDSIQFYPDQLSTSDSLLFSSSGGTAVTGGDTINTGGLTHGLKNGQYIEVDSTDIVGLTAGNKYYANVVSTTEFKLSPNIGGEPVSLTNDTGLSISCVENRFIEMVPDSVAENQRYQNTISTFSPSIILKSLVRFVTIPEVFKNV